MKSYLIRFLIKKQRCHVLVLVLILASYFSLILNFPFITRSFAFLFNEETFWSTVAFFLTPFVLFFIFLSLFSILAIPYIEKPIFIVLLLLCTLLNYSYVYYGFMFDDYPSILASLEVANWAEIKPFLTLSGFAYFFIFGIIPSYFIYKTTIVHFHLKGELLFKALGALAYPFFYFLIFFLFLHIFHPMFRLSGLAGRPPYQIFPTNFFENAYNHYLAKFNSTVPYKTIGTDAKNVNQKRNGRNSLVVLVIGETARAMNFGLNGYYRDTNGYTRKQNVTSFRNATACSTSTRVSVPCIFSSLNRKNFTLTLGGKQDNLLDVLHYSGLNLFWIDNNGGGDCQGVCDRIQSNTIIMEADDSDLVEKLSEQLAQLKPVDSVIVLHLLGSHGPDYYAKYPAAFRRFTPDCQKTELRFCSQEELINAYDNSLLYTDYLLSEIIEKLKAQPQWNTALIYTSDHGESIGEHGIYGHCAPYAIAPKEQTHVPFIVWGSEAFLKEKHLSLSCLNRAARKNTISHDHFFHSVLGIMDIQTSIYERDLDLFHSCRSLKIANNAN